MLKMDLISLSVQMYFIAETLGELFIVFLLAILYLAWWTTLSPWQLFYQYLRLPTQPSLFHLTLVCLSCFPFYLLLTHAENNLSLFNCLLNEYMMRKHQISVWGTLFHLVLQVEMQAWLCLNLPFSVLSTLACIPPSPLVPISTYSLCFIIVYHFHGWIFLFVNSNFTFPIAQFQ